MARVKALVFEAFVSIFQARLDISRLHAMIPVGGGVLGAPCESSSWRHFMNTQEKIHQTPSGNIHYWVTPGNSDKPWLVFLPGLTADHHLFDRQVPAFPEYNRLVWDAPAHAASRPFALDFSLEDMARYLHEILTAEGVGSCVLIGQSLGGYIGQSYLNLYPGTVSGFVSIDSASLSRKYFSGWELALLKDTRWMYELIPWKLLLKLGVMGTSRTPYGRELMEKTWAVYDRADYLDLTVHGFRILAEAVQAQPEYKIDCPALLLCGEKDAAGSGKRYNRRWAKEDGLPLVWLKGAGHNSNTDVPEEVNRLINEFLQGHCL